MKIDKEIALVAFLTLLVAGAVGYVAFGHRGEWNEYRHHRAWQANGRYDSGMMMHGWNDTAAPRYQNNHDDHGMHMMDMMVTSERSFIEAMIPHHQEAVDTAKEVLARGATTPAIKTLAENIVTTQTAEIADMQQWYQDWYGIPYTDAGSYEPMMRDLGALSGTELDRTFLSDMIMHHKGAIMMARSVTPYVEHSEMTELTQAIIAAQSEEITKMRMMLQEL